MKKNTGNITKNTSAFLHCPACGHKGLSFSGGKEYRCEPCGFTWFRNPAPAAGVILHDRRCILVIERAADPCRGMWALPGGFVDAGESAEEAAARECLEETGMLISTEDLRFVASRPNRYDYAGLVYDTCDMVFSCRVDVFPDLKTIHTEETASAFTVAFNDIDPLRFAFPSIREILGIWLEGRD